MAYGDMLTFNHQQIRESIDLMNSIKGEIVKLKNEYIRYVNGELRKQWYTQNGQKTADQLINFANTDIESFITYLQNRIDDLGQAAANAQKIDVA